MMAYIVDDNLDEHFCVELLRRIKFVDFSESTALPAINLTRLRNCAVSVPSLPEQRAIAAVLGDMDAEIAALVRERAEAGRIKQGMMQELLTGKTRLMEGE